VVQFKESRICFRKGTTLKTSKEKLERSELYQELNAVRIQEEPVVFSPLFQAGEKQVSFICTLEDVTEDAVFFKNPFPLELVKKIQSCIEFTIFSKMYLIRSEKVESQGTLLKFPLPDFALHKQMRIEQRTSFSPKLKNHILIKHPFDQGTTLRRRLLDLSSGGLSFCAPKESAFIQVGRSLPEVKVVVANNVVQTSKAQIVYAKRIIDTTLDSPATLMQVGIKFIDS
jgi:c-di-GMP-binding flagellar brake protein YcgR